MKMLKVTETLKSLARQALVVCPSLMAIALAGQSYANAAEFANFTQAMPNGTVKFDMVAIPEGEVTIGSPESEAGRDKADQAQKKVKVKRFWMGKCEVTWAEFLPYVFISQSEVAKFENKLEGIIDKDGLTHPTKPYGSVYRDRGEKPANPAIGMGYPNAVNYCKWLSKKTGRHYRLPTEAEWEYACRAGATTAFFWGDDAAQAKDYAWYKENAGEGTHLVGKLKPNKFGLFDIVGNVGEWCAKEDAKGPGVLRGGAWDQEATKLRSAARMVEVEEWNENDPQSPQSIWWLSAADFTGFRVVCDEESGDTAAAAPAAAAQPAAAAAPAAAAGGDVKALYLAQCKGCHGATGKGDTKPGKLHGARDYTTADVKATYDEAKWVEAIKNGIEKDGKHIMNAFKEKLNEEQMKALAVYMKNL